ncbi:hypothetical protein FTUN_1593 [Frigoriglobus tundricola]|uniref:Uncharacterized protein n=1 Tax=Frigoriglobus tundricola TaxID=2774151 RepID=A0A6M5YKH3_9BACT|nr:hypothetical protein FTUN_1593 [Frigoriglobus tundricola]
MSHGVSCLGVVSGRIRARGAGPRGSVMESYQRKRPAEKPNSVR